MARATTNTTHYLGRRGRRRRQESWPKGRAMHLWPRLEARADLKSGNFEAVCKNCAGLCRRTTTSYPPKRWRIVTHPGQGRPVGDLVAWLLHGAANNKDHKIHDPPRPARLDGRNLAKQSASGRQLLAQERPKGADPYSEPNSPI